MTDQSNLPGLLLAPAGTSPEQYASRSATRKKASTACSACRSRRSKCTGGIPCLACISHRTSCVKDESEDGRRRTAIKRKLEVLEENRLVLESLLAALRTGSESNVASLLNLIRTNTSRQDLQDFLKQSFPESNLSSSSTEARRGSQVHPRIDERVGSPTFVRRSRTGGIGDLINPPIQVPAKPWTNVTDDDDLVSHLISLWFTWLHPCFRWVEEKIFVEAMRSQDLASPLCSPYLVNSILAEACCLDAPDGRGDSFHSQLRESFLAAATAGIEAEKARASLTLIQAIGVKWTSLHLNGEDRMCRVVLNTQAFLYKGLEKWRQRISKNSRTSLQSLADVDKSIQFLSWTLFALGSFNLANLEDMNQPSEPRDAVPGLHHQNASPTVWISYPLHRNIQTEFHVDCHFRHLVKLAQYITENEQLSRNRQTGRFNVDAFQNLIQRIQDWPSHLPPCLQLRGEAMPHVLTLHALHNWVSIVLAKQAAAADAGHPMKPVVTITPASPQGNNWREHAFFNAIAISHIMQNYKRAWGADYFPPLVLQPISMAVLTLLEDLESAENEAAFVNLSRCLHSASSKFRVGRGVIQIVRNAARDKGLTLPAAVEEIFRAQESRTSDVEMSSEGSDRRLGSGSPEREDITVDYLLDKWADLDLDSDLD